MNNQISYSFGDLRLVAMEAIEQKRKTVDVDPRSLLKLCESEAWAHDTLAKLQAKPGGATKDPEKK